MSESSARVVRVHLRSAIRRPDEWVAIENHCLRQDGGWVGVGWGIWGDELLDGISWDEYARRKVEQGEIVDESVRRLHALPVGSLAWTRRRNGTYWLGEITGPWRYLDSEATRALDLFNVRPCRWWEVGTEDAVPGKIVNNFRPSRTVNPVADAVAVRYSHKRHRELRGLPSTGDSPTPEEVITSLLGPTDLEDLVAVFLQDTYDLVLVSRGRSTPGYEYVLRSRQTGRRALATVKSGGSRPELDRLPHDGQTDLYAYAASGPDADSRYSDVRWISTADLAQFIVDRSKILPENVLRWLSGPTA